MKMQSIPPATFRLQQHLQPTKATSARNSSASTAAEPGPPDLREIVVVSDVARLSAMHDDETTIPDVTGQDSTSSFHTDDTIPNTPPKPWEASVSAPHGGSFARIRPLSEYSKEAFLTVTARMRSDATFATNARRFITWEKDGTGCYNLSMTTPPLSLAAGWVVGTDETTADILLLDPQSSLSSAARVSHRHCQLAFGPDSDALLLRSQPGKEVIINGCEVVKFEPRMLARHTGIQIGALAYIFDFTPDYPQAVFREQLQDMRERRGWTNPEILPALTPTPGTDAIVYRGFHIEKATLWGASAMVSFGRRLSDSKPIVAKRLKVPNSRSAIAAARNEIQNLQSLKHPSIVHLASGFEPDLSIFADFQTPMQECILIMEPALPQTLVDLIRAGQGTLEDALYLLRDVLDAVTYLHLAGYMHHDLKPANIGVSTTRQPPRAILLDLGHTRMSVTSRDHMLGTISYLAPEVILLKRSAKAPAFNAFADVWSVGLTFAEMILQNIVSTRWRADGITSLDHDRLKQWLANARSSSVMSGVNSIVVTAVFDSVEQMLSWEVVSRSPADVTLRRMQRAVHEIEVQVQARPDVSLHESDDTEERETKRLRY